ncbi:MAG: hypothetical protein QXZ12_06940 [Thermoplasmata archaeon]
MENEEQKQKEEIQDKISNTENQKDVKIEGAEIIEQQPLLVLHRNDWVRDIYQTIYPKHICKLKIGESIGISAEHPNFFRETEVITKLFENADGTLVLHETFTQIEETNTIEVKRKLLWII